MEWVRLQSIQYISDHGRQVKHMPGEWVKIGKQLATSWLLAGLADRPDIDDLSLISNAGVQITDESNYKWARGILPGIDMESNPLPLLNYPKTLVWDGKTAINPEFIASGFHLLDTWEMVIPLWSYDKLACDIGSYRDKQKTETIIRDLRVPCYRSDFLFVRQCEAVEGVIKAWLNSTIQDSKLALLCAIYEVKPLILALPTTWVE
jgi:hypothetical protein